MIIITHALSWMRTEWMFKNKAQTWAASALKRMTDSGIKWSSNCVYVMNKTCSINVEMISWKSAYKYARARSQRSLHQWHININYYACLFWFVLFLRGFFVSLSKKITANWKKNTHEKKKEKSTKEPNDNTGSR